MATEWFTITDIAQKANMSETTARRYASLFAAFLPSRTIGRTKKYAPETAGLLMRVAALYQEGLSTPEVLEWLQREFPQTVEVEEENPLSHLPSITTPPSLVLALLAAQNTTLTHIAETLDKLAAQSEEISAMRAELDALRQQHEAEKQHREDRDQQIVAAMRRMLSEPQPLKRSWWPFGRRRTPPE